jgi:hypothetical protein
VGVFQKLLSLLRARAHSDFSAPLLIGAMALLAGTSVRGTR